MTTDNNVLFLVMNQTQFNELFRVAKFLKKSEKYSILFYFYDTLPGPLKKMSLICVSESIDFIVFNFKGNKKNQEIIYANKGIKNRGYSILKFIKNKKISIRTRLFVLTKSFNAVLCKYIKIDILYDISEFFRNFKYYHNQLIDAHKIFYKYEPNLIIVPEDGVGGNLSFIKVAKDKNIPIIIIPYEYSTMKQPLEYIQSFPNCAESYGMNTLNNRIIAKILPKWVYDVGDKKFLRLPSQNIIPLEMLKLSPEIPWTVHGGNADYLVVESEIMYRHYINEGIPAKKLLPLGSVTNDDLFSVFKNQKEYRKDLCKSLGLQDNRLLILCALPGDYTDRINCDFSKYEDLIDYWISVLTGLEGINLVFQLHPAINDNQEQYIKKKGVIISHSNITNLIPLCDILVTSVSSIIRMAIICKKPVINYDVYRFEYNDYDEAKGVLTVQEQHEFKILMRKITHNKPFYDDIILEQTKIADNWGKFDGKSGERISYLIDSLMENKS